MSIWKSHIWTADKDAHMKAIFAVMNTTWAVVKIRPKKIQARTGLEAMTPATPAQRSTNRDNRVYLEPS